MDIAVDRELPYVYWQAIVYETYENETWERTEDAKQDHFPEEGPIDAPFTRAREVVTQTVYSYFPNSSFIYGAPEITNVDRPLILYARTDGNGDKLVSAVRSRYILQQGDNYEVVSRLSVADAASLRAASPDYPAWVNETYLQLPDTITPETLALAEELTAPYDNAYDKAVAVQNYLRENITYNDQIPAPPDGTEPVHYTLFVSQEGYCNYYASAMAVMLRSQGIPARLVSGYAQGTYDEESHVYRVRASNSHTWVEVYFPTYGWVQFEPTASIPVITRPENLDNTSGDAFSEFYPNRFEDQEALLAEGEFLARQNDPDLRNGGDNSSSGSTSFAARFPFWQALGAILVVATAVALSFLANNMNRRVEMDVDRSYRRLSSWARWVGVEHQPTQTPYERADSLATAVPEGKESIRTLTRQYVLKQFSRQRAYEDGFEPLVHWKALRPLLLRKSITTRLQRLQQKSYGRRRYGR
jgi:transglutaminase-like putative cysteine protease